MKRLVITGLTAGLVLVCSGSAAAEVTFCPLGSGAGQCEKPEGVAVDRSSGNVYVVDSGNNRIDVFDSGGNFVNAFGWGVVDGTTNALQACTSTCFRGIAGSGSGQFQIGDGDAGELNRRIQVGVGPGGTVYVADTAVFGAFESARVQSFNTSGELIKQLLRLEERSETNSLAVDSVGDFYVGIEGRSVSPVEVLARYEAERARIALETGTTLPLPPPVSAATEDSGRKLHPAGGRGNSAQASHSPISAAKRRTCGPARGKTVVVNRQVRIYSLPGSNPPETERIFGCLVSPGRVRQLSPIGKSKFPVRMGEPFVLQAPWVGGIERARGFDTSRLKVRAVNLRTGVTNVCFVGSGLAPHSAGEVASIALKPNGSLAWAGKGHFGVAGKYPPSSEIVACDSEGDRVLDSGEGTDLHSLILHGSELTWSNSGIERTAVLH